VQPITPGEVVLLKGKQIPTGVIRAFNEMIAMRWNGHSATIQQPEIVSAIQAMLNCERDKIFDNGWLEVEEIYREAGWEVEYDKPGYNEYYDAYFVFKRRLFGK
jgi:hypothetical protein